MDYDRTANPPLNYIIPGAELKQIYGWDKRTSNSSLKINPVGSARFKRT
jgi:hypothetical protein